VVSVCGEVSLYFSLMLYGVGHLLDDFHCTDTDGADPLEQIDYMLFVVGKFVGVELFVDGGIT